MIITAKWFIAIQLGAGFFESVEKRGLRSSFFVYIVDLASHIVYKIRMMKKRDYKAIEMLERIAQDVSPIKSARIASAIYINNRLISVGVNQNKTDPLQSRFVRNDKCGALIHSEIASIKAALKRVDVDDLSNAILYICRMKYDTQRENGGTMSWGLCKPCSGCEKAINAFNIKRVVYTTDEGTLEEMTK